MQIWNLHQICDYGLGTLETKKKKVVWETRLAEWWENICPLAVWCDFCLFVKQTSCWSRYSRFPLLFYLTSIMILVDLLYSIPANWCSHLPQSCWEYVLVYSGQFSNDCWKTNTTSCNLLKIKKKARCDWFRFCFSLVEKLMPDF